MREIKFRGKTGTFDGSWAYGCLLVDKTHYETARYEIVENPLFPENGQVVSLESVGQYIGQHDALDREIYEGDIVYFGNNQYSIQYLEKYGRFAATAPERGVVFTVFSFNKCIVVGNMTDGVEKVWMDAMGESK